jgi:type II secretory pathway component PulF
MRDEQEAKGTHAVVPAILLAAFHGVLWMVLLGMMLGYVPVFARIFADFDAELPVISIWVWHCSSLSVRYWFLVLPCIAVLCAVDLVVLYALYLRPGLAIGRWLWLALMLLVPLGLMGLTVLATFLPLRSLIQSLS